MAMDIHHLVTMANQIAGFFKSSKPDRAEAVAATAQHLRSVWDPRMRREIIVHLAANGGEGLSEIARDAVRTLEAAASAKTAGQAGPGGDPDVPE
jgi:formate dehydrogenase subunit delta